MKYRKIAPIAIRSKTLQQIEMADRLGIEKIQISNPVTNFSGNEPEGPEEVRKKNDVVNRALKQYPDRFIGFLP